MELNPCASSHILFDVVNGVKAQEELLNLLNRCFRVPAGKSYYDDFPVWDERFCLPMLRVGAYEGRSLVASASIRVAALSTPCGSLPVGIIGGVVTDSMHQRQGLATKTVSLVLQWAKENKIPLVILWGSEHALYQKLGFDLCGEQLRISLAELPKNTKIKHFTIQRGWNSRIMSFLCSRSEGLRLAPADEAWISAHKNVDWWWVESTGRLIAYAAVGRGIDLKGLVHEWGGEREALMVLLGEICQAGVGAEIVGTRRLFNKYGINTESLASEFLCLARVLDPYKIFKAYWPNNETALPALNDPSLVRILFGPGTESQFWNKQLPLPLWFWGLDGA